MTDGNHGVFFRPWFALFSVRLLVGIVLVLLLVPISIDDDIRIFHAQWWYELPSFSPSHFWVPGYFYLYGLVVGLTGDGLIAPRLLTLFLHLLIGAILMIDHGRHPRERLLASVWVLFSPLSLVLGTVPLAETLFMGLAFGGVVCIGSWLRNGNISRLVLASLFYVGASMVRYEGWILIPVFSMLACSRKPVGVHRVYGIILAVVPWVVPVTWSLWFKGRTGEAFGYLRNIELDSHGVGDIWGALGQPLAVLNAVQFIVAGAVVGIALWRFLRGVVKIEEICWEAHAAASLLLVLWSFITGNVPSQYPIRLLYPAIMFAAIPVAGIIGSNVTGARLRLVGLAMGGILLISGMGYALSLEPGCHVPGYRAGLAINSMYTEGTLGSDDHVLVDKQLPESYSVVVYSNRSDLVHLNDTGSLCWLNLLECAPGRKPAWAEAVKAVVAWHDQRKRYLLFLGWKPIARNDRWVTFFRPDGSPPLGACLPPKAGRHHFPLPLAGEGRDGVKNPVGRIGDLRAVTW